MGNLASCVFNGCNPCPEVMDTIGDCMDKSIEICCWPCDTIYDKYQDYACRS